MAPLFILGFPRSGTTAMAAGLAALGRWGRVGVEGHFIYHFAPGLAAIADGRINPASLAADPVRRDRALGEFARFLNRTFSPRSDPDDIRWIDKTPDVAQVRAVAVIGRIYPTARFVFLYRPPADAIRSNLAVFRRAVEGNEARHAARWATLHALWRERRAGLSPTAYVEVFQPDMRADPAAVARHLAPVLALDPAETERLAEFWRANPSIARPVGERAARYDGVRLAPDVAAQVAALTDEECRHWPRLAPAVAAE
jgi:hypothetical protein